MRRSSSSASGGEANFHASYGVISVSDQVGDGGEHSDGLRPKHFPMPRKVQPVPFTASECREPAVVIVNQVAGEEDLLPFGSFNECHKGDGVEEFGVGEAGVDGLHIGPHFKIRPAVQNGINAQVGETHDALLRICCTVSLLTPSLQPICSADS